MSPAQDQVLRDITATPGSLEKAFERYRDDHPRLPYIVADRSFTKVLEALLRRGLIVEREGYYHPASPAKATP